MPQWVNRPVFHNYRANRQKTMQVAPKNATATGQERKESLRDGAFPDTAQYAWQP